MNDLQSKIAEYRQGWIRKGQYVEPNLTDALDFMVSEVAEAIDKRLRLSNYVRNNDEGCPTKEDIAIEVFDAIMMGCVALDLLGFDLDEVADKKLKIMDDKRK